MKYFSPNILDGSVTTAKIANLAVTEAKLASNSITRLKINTTVTSQGGSISGGGLVVVSLSPYTFFADIEAENVTSGRLGPFTKAVPNGSADQPQFQVHNPDGPARNYDVEWRNVDA